MAADGLDDDAHFLSPTNSGANADQRAIEARALEIMATPTVAAARERARFMWRSITGAADDEVWRQFDDALEEYVFNASLKAANSDANHPRVLSAIFGPPHEWFGRKVPGSRLGGDNPDNHYSVIPLDGEARFELRGRRLEPAPADINFTVMGNTTLSKTFASLEGRDLEVGPDGGFVVTIGPDAPEGRRNHLQTRPGTLYMFIRESRSDWRQRPARMRIRRLDAPAAAAPNLDQLAERAADIIVYDVPWTYWWMGLCFALKPNEMAAPFKTVSVGGLYSQQVSFGHLFLADDEAFVITVTPGGAGFRNLVLHNHWYTSFDTAAHLSCLNSGQAASDTDGRYTYVVSHRDPGIHNWLDPVGRHELLLVHRWQDLPRDPGAGEPAIASRLVKLGELPGILHDGVARIDAASRRRQLAERAAQFRLRFDER